MSGQTGGAAGGSSKKPKGPVSAYAFFVRNCWAVWKQDGSEKLSFADQSKKCAELWKEMDAFQKKPFVELQEQDKKRYEKEISSYVPPAGTTAAKGAGTVAAKGAGTVAAKGAGTVAVKGVKVKRMKKVKDPNAPKRALSAFFWFGHDERAKVKGANPEFGIGDVAKELGRMWGGMNDAAKSQYQTMAAQDKARYQKEMAEYKEQAASRAAAAVKMEEDDDDEFEGEEEQEYEYNSLDDDFVY